MPESITQAFLHEPVDADPFRMAELRAIIGNPHLYLSPGALLMGGDYVGKKIGQVLSFDLRQSKATAYVSDLPHRFIKIRANGSEFVDFRIARGGADLVQSQGRKSEQLRATIMQICADLLEVALVEGRGSAGGSLNAQAKCFVLSEQRG